VKDIGVRRSPLHLLAVIRMVNGATALVAPQVYTSRMGATSADGATKYAFRLFGIRALVSGWELLAPESQRRWLPELTVLVHASDVVSAYAAGRQGEVSRDFSRMTVALSGLNTALAVAGLVQSRRR